LWWEEDRGTNDEWIDDDILKLYTGGDEDLVSKCNTLFGST